MSKARATKATVKQVANAKAVTKQKGNVNKLGAEKKKNSSITGLFFQVESKQKNQLNRFLTENRDYSQGEILKKLLENWLALSTDVARKKALAANPGEVYAAIGRILEMVFMGNHGFYGRRLMWSLETYRRLADLTEEAPALRRYSEYRATLIEIQLTRQLRDAGIEKLKSKELDSFHNHYAEGIELLEIAKESFEKIREDLVKEQLEKVEPTYHAILLNHASELASLATQMEIENEVAAITFSDLSNAAEKTEAFNKYFAPMWDETTHSYQREEGWASLGLDWRILLSKATVRRLQKDIEDALMNLADLITIIPDYDKHWLYRYIHREINYLFLRADPEAGEKLKVILAPLDSENPLLESVRNFREELERNRRNPM
jgi:hypothetical protein